MNTSEKNDQLWVKATEIKNCIIRGSQDAYLLGYEFKYINDDLYVNINNVKPSLLHIHINIQSIDCK